jgi:hypothetical protein
MTTATQTAPAAFNTLADIRLAASKFFDAEPAAVSIGYLFNIGGGKTIEVWVDRNLTCWDHNPHA